MHLARIPLWRSAGSCLPRPDRKGYRGQSGILQVLTSFGTQPEQLRHVSRIAKRRESVTTLCPSLVEIKAFTEIHLPEPLQEAKG